MNSATWTCSIRNITTNYKYKYGYKIQIQIWIEIQAARKSSAVSEETLPLGLAK